MIRKRTPMFLALLSCFFAGTAFLEAIFPNNENPTGVRWKTLSEMPNYSGSCPTAGQGAVALFIEDYTNSDIAVTLKASGRISDVLYLYALSPQIRHVDKNTSTVVLKGLKKETPSYVVLCSKTRNIIVQRLTANRKNYYENSNAISFVGRTEGKIRVWAKWLFIPFLLIAFFFAYRDVKIQSALTSNKH